MHNTKKNNLKLGFFVAIGIVLFIFGIYYIGSQVNLFSKKFQVSGIFTDISGLKVGNNVRFSGINIGTVSQVQIINDSLVSVDLSIQEGIRQFIRKDSKIEIGSEGLMGNKIVNIYSGNIHTANVEEGDILGTIEVVKIDNILRQLNSSSINTVIITKNVAEITEKINRGEGAFGKIFADESFATNLSKIAKKTASLTENVAEITDKMSKEKGTIGMLLSDTILAKKIYEAGENLQKSTDNLVKITNQVNSGQGIFGEIFTDTTFTSGLSRTGKNLDYTAEKTKILSENLVKITDEINEGQGLINRLIYDTAFADSIEIAVQNVNKGAKEVEEAAKVVKRNWLIRLFSKKEKK
ncbi:MAG: MlaD family protein [Bacteroidales bacterium]|jgi:phospholipid/cholesterol/gamma-HCH transport system substrate-binding protein|nr:MlaD family protein [Bacteroidales bacterium]